MEVIPARHRPLRHWPLDWIFNFNLTTMKKERIIVIVALSIMMSCSDSFLELTPQQSVADTEALTNLEDFNSSITGIYNKISGSNYFGRYRFLIPDVMADDVKQNAQANRIEDYAEHIVRVSDGDANSLWTTMYQGINAANAIINSQVDLPDTVVDEYDHIVGEAHALRGLIYFDMVNFFAQHYKFSPDATHFGVPLVLEFDLSTMPSRNSVKEVYDQVISDLELAISLMKDQSRSGNSNTLSAISAKALLARVFLYKEDWANAETMANEVIETNKYGLIPNENYYSLWTTDNSSESIFEISMTEVDNVGGQGIAGLYLPQGFGDYLPSNDVISLYEPGDARLSTFAVDPLLIGEFAPYRMIKYPDINGFDNVKVIRLAELYLIRAEAKAKLGDDTQGAQDDLDRVRQRALPTAPDNLDTGT